MPDYPVHLFFTRDGYFKKITPQSLRMSGEQKLKEGDQVAQEVESVNSAHLLFFSDKGQVYKAQAADFDDTKASVMGDFIPAKLGMEEGESAVYMAVTTDYSGYLFFAFADGRMAKVEMSSYATKTRRRKLMGAYSLKSPLVGMACGQDREFLLTASGGRMLLVNTAALAAKSTRDTQGVAVMTLRKRASVIAFAPYEAGTLAGEHRYRARSLPAAGALPRPEDQGEQLTL